MTSPLVVFLHVLGAAAFVGGTLSILVTNRALKRRLSDAERRDMVRYLGRAAAPILLTGFALSAATGLVFWQARGWSLAPLLLAKATAALVAGGATAIHIALGRRERPRAAVAAALGIATLVGALALLWLGAELRFG